MESMDDFEVFFYNGAKVIKSPNDDVRVYDKHGRLLKDHEEPTARNLLQHQEECLKHCQAICSVLQLVQTSGNCCFPAVVGRRPSDMDVVLGQCITTAMRDTTNFIYLTPKSQQVKFVLYLLADIFYKQCKISFRKVLTFQLEPYLQDFVVAPISVTLRRSSQWDYISINYNNNK